MVENSSRTPTTGELGYDRPLYDGFLYMTDVMLGPSPMHIKYSSYVCTTDFAYDGPIFLVPLSLSYPSSPVLQSESKVYLTQLHKYHSVRSFFIYNLIYM